VSDDLRLARLREAIQAIKEGRPVPPPGDDPELAQLERELVGLGASVDARVEELRQLVRVIEQINAGVLLEDVLGHIYTSFHPLIPFQRIGFSLIEEGGTRVRAHWARSEAPVIRLEGGYTASLEGSSLKTILETGQPRILNDLEAYLREHPRSEATALIVREGMRSSLTCPLRAMGEPIGFLFFSCTRPHAFLPEHVELIRMVAGQLALIVEKSRLYEKLVALNAQKNLLLGVAAHDLRGPIAVIQGFIDLAREGLAGPVTAKQQEIFSIVRKTCGGMLALINNFLDVSAIEAGRLQLDPREVELAAFVRECHQTTSLLAEAKGIRLALDLEPELGTAVFDPDRITQVIGNLIGNAIKFSHPHTVVTLRARSRDDQVELAVEDQGQGIPGEDLPRLFQTFGPGSVRPTGGERTHGLGLAIVRRMVEAHGGSVHAESRVGVGSTFTVRLPRRALALSGDPG